LRPETWRKGVPARAVSELALSTDRPVSSVDRRYLPWSLKV
jgi:hypothetical protein